MLLQTPQRVPYTLVFKTSSGEEFIGRVSAETDTSFTVDHPLCMVDTPQGLRFAPFLMMADSTIGVVIPKPIITATPAKKLEEQYQQATSSIVIARTL